MFLVMGALVRTGALDWFTQTAERQAKDRPLVALGVLMGFVIVARANELATITSPISLSGFTAAWDSVPAPIAPAQ